MLREAQSENAKLLKIRNFQDFKVPKINFTYPTIFQRRKIALPRVNIVECKYRPSNYLNSRLLGKKRRKNFQFLARKIQFSSLEFEKVFSPTVLEINLLIFQSGLFEKTALY